MATYDIALITDSTSDLPDAILQQYQISMVPLVVIWGTQELFDRRDITATEFYQRLVTDPVHPKTSQVAPKAFAEAVEKAKQSGAREALIVTISNKLSATYNSALLSREMVDIPVHVIDGKTASMSLGFQVMAAARAREAGGGLQEMIAAVHKVQKTMKTILYVDTLEFLHKGGRISSAAKWIGTALQMKPILYVDEEGAVQAGPKVRTRRKAVETLYQKFFSELDTTKPLHVAVTNGNADEEARFLIERIRQDYKPVELMEGLTTPTIGVHTGPGAFALCGYNEE